MPFPRRSSVSRFGGRGRRRATAWSGPFTMNLDDTGTGLHTLVTLVPTEAETTIVRVRGSMIFQFLPDTVNDVYLGAIGLITVQAAASAAGSASMPGPVTDASNDGWFWHSFVDFMASGVGAEVPGYGYRVDIDSKAMRKVNDNERVVMRLESTTHSAGVSVKVAGDFRVLSKLV